MATRKRYILTKPPRDLTEEMQMWSSALSMLVATGFGLVAASGASAAPANGSAIAEVAHRTDAVIQVP
jgi:hypothetical protein